MKIQKTHPALRQRFQRGNNYHFFRCGAILHSHTLVNIYVTMSSLVPHDETPPPRLRTLPSDKQIITPRYEAECTSIVHLVHNLRAHLRANSALIGRVEEILWMHRCLRMMLMRRSLLLLLSSSSYDVPLSAVVSRVA